MPRHTKTLKERFDEKWVPVPESGCWIWIGSCDPHGYARLSLNGFMALAHRVAVVLYKKAVLNRRIVVIHKCNIRSCVNPEHLYAGTRQDQVAHMQEHGLFAKGESVGTYGTPRDEEIKIACSLANRGEGNGMAKLTEQDILAIRASEGAHTEIAAVFGVSDGCICNIRNRKTWKHI
jgi:hypothetical protein